MGRKLAVRGTVRLALKRIGCDSRSVTQEELGEALQVALPAELRRRGLANVDELCRRLSGELSQQTLKAVPKASAAESPLFNWLSESLEKKTSWSRLEARGTVRLAAKLGGVDPDSATEQELAGVIQYILPDELERRGIDGKEMCRELLGELKTLDVKAPKVAPEAPDEVFERLFGSTAPSETEALG